MYLLYSIVLDFLNANNYPIIDSVLEESKTYLVLATLCIILPFFYWLIFYKFYSNPYAKFFHWVIALALSLMIVCFLSYTTVNEAIWGSNNLALNDLLANDQTAIEIAESLPIYLCVYNLFLATISGIIFSLFLKRFSKIQIQLPF